MNTNLLQFALFAGEECYPAGGFRDFIISGTLDECKARFSSWRDPQLGYREFDWAHIADLSSMQIVLVAEGDGSESVVWAAHEVQECASN